MAKNITAQMVKELRDKTGAGMMDCKAALGETGGELEQAVDWLRKKGKAKADMKNDQDFWDVVEVVPGEPLMKKADANMCMLGSYT